MAGRKVTRDDLRKAAEKYKNWGKWGPDDEIGPLKNGRMVVQQLHAGFLVIGIRIA